MKWDQEKETTKQSALKRDIKIRMYKPLHEGTSWWGKKNEMGGQYFCIRTHISRNVCIHLQTFRFTRETYAKFFGIAQNHCTQSFVSESKVSQGVQRFCKQTQNQWNIIFPAIWFFFFIIMCPSALSKKMKSLGILLKIKIRSWISTFICCSSVTCIPLAIRLPHSVGSHKFVWSNTFIYLISESYKSSEWAILAGKFQ